MVSLGQPLYILQIRIHCKTIYISKDIIAYALYAVDMVHQTKPYYSLSLSLSLCLSLSLVLSFYISFIFFLSILTWNQVTFQQLQHGNKTTFLWPLIWFQVPIIYHYLGHLSLVVESGFQSTRTKLKVNNKKKINLKNINR